LKTFLLLALDDSDPYWSTEVTDLPALNETKYLPVPHMIVTQQPGNAVLYPSGVSPATLVSGHMAEKYSKFAYSSLFGFNVRKANDCLENMAPDCDLVFKYGNLFFGRNNVSSYKITETEIETQWSPFPGIEVTTTITPSPHGHSRQHIIKSTVECIAYDCGFAMPTDATGYSQETTDNSAYVRSTLGSCMVYIYNPSGSGASTSGMIISASPNTNLLFPRSAIPAVSHTISIGTTNIYTTVLLGS
jgi:hypothetical protein